MSDPVTTVAGFGGILSGYASAVYLIFKRLRRLKPRLYSVSGYYRVPQGLSGVVATVSLIAVNATDEIVSLTDIIGLIRYEKGKVEAEYSTTPKAIRDIKFVFSQRPANFSEVIPLTLGPKESRLFNLRFNFPDVDSTRLDRFRVLHFGGFDKRGIPHGIAIVNEPVTDENAVIMLIQAHINGKRVINAHASLVPGEPSGDQAHGTLTPIQQRVIERDFWTKGLP